jgi:hypothetical protein
MERIDDFQAIVEKKFWGCLFCYNSIAVTINKIAGAKPFDRLRVTTNLRQFNEFESR